MGAGVNFSTMLTNIANCCDASTKNTKPDKLIHRLKLCLQDMTSYEPDINHRIWQVVAAIPKGKVATYGCIARKAGLARAARRVGLALRGLPKNTQIPWHRVINAQGRISLPEGSNSHQIQRSRLEAEGILFRANGTVNLMEFGW
jgi:methylated-DNA-protein-cysteine methyltransferase-like protein